MFERPKSGERAVLVHLDLGSDHGAVLLAEFAELAHAAGAEVLDTVHGSRRTPEPRFFIGEGKANEVAERVKALKADLVLVNHALSPSQELA